MVRCVLPDCNNTYGKYRLFAFPRNEARRKLWISRCYLTSVGRHARLCEAHFDDSQFELKRRDGWKRLKLDAVPTLFPEPIKILNMNIEKCEPVEVIKVKEEKSCKRKTIKDDNIKDTKKACVGNFQCVVKLEELPKDWKAGKVFSDFKSDASNGSLLSAPQRNIKHEDMTESDEDAGENSTIVRNGNEEIDETNDSQLLALMKQWNVVLKEELVELRQKEKTEKLKNEILLERTLELNDKIKNLQSRLSDIKEKNCEVERNNKLLKIHMDNMQELEQKRAYNLQKKVFQEAIKKLYFQNKDLLVEKESMRLLISEFNKKHRRISDMKKDSNSKLGFGLLDHEKKLFKINSENMFQTIIELKKQNKFLNEKLLEFQDGKADGTITERELLQMQIKTLKSQNQAMITENECMLEEIQEFVTSSKSMHDTVTELEKHNSVVNCKLKDLEEENICMAKKILDLENEIKNLKKDDVSEVHSSVSDLKQLENDQSSEPGAV